jgi:hypothetical protein
MSWRMKCETGKESVNILAQVEFGGVKEKFM